MQSPVLRTLLSLFWIYLSIVVSLGQEYKRVCYHTYWSSGRPGIGRFTLDLYEPGLCTHLIYSFAQVKFFASTNRAIISSYEVNEDNGFQFVAGYQQMNNLKSRQSNLKTLLAVGGWTHASRGFTEMVNTYERRQQFIQYAIDYLKHHNFDGLDLDWEYPAQRGSPPGDKPKFTLLCKELSEAFADQGLLVTAAVAAGQGSAGQSYEIAEISKYLDFINLMTYDLHGPWEGSVGHQTDSDKTLATNQLSVWNSVKFYLNNGASPDKLVLGLATYGRTQNLKDPCSWELGSPTTWSGGAAGQYTQASGFLAFYEICKLGMKERVCTGKSRINAPYGATASYAIGYDDEESIRYKVENIMKGYNLGGYMFWAMDLDDFSGYCGGRKFPLMKMAKDISLNNNPTITVPCNDISSNEICIPPTTTPPPPGACRVNPLGVWRSLVNDANHNKWCYDNCPQHTDSSVCGEPGETTNCICGTDDTTATTASLSPAETTYTLATSATDKPVTTATVPTTATCSVNPLGAWKALVNNDGFEKWCSDNCPQHTGLSICGEPGGTSNCICKTTATMKSSKLTTITSATTTTQPATTTATTTTTTTEEPTMITSTSTTTTSTTTKQPTTTTSTTTTEKPTTSSTTSTTTTSTTTKQPTTTTSATTTEEPTTSSTTSTTTTSTTSKPPTTTTSTTSIETTIVSTDTNNCQPPTFSMLAGYCSSICAISSCAQIRLYCTLPQHCL